jgi:uncharacterized protein YjiS (DUF1127 family)
VARLFSKKGIAMTTKSATPYIHRCTALRAAADLIAFASLLDRAWTWLLTCSERRRQRLMLATLNEHRLADLGLSQSDVSREADNWPWQN